MILGDSLLSYSARESVSPVCSIARTVTRCPFSNIPSSVSFSRIKHRLTASAYLKDMILQSVRLPPERYGIPHIFPPQLPISFDDVVSVLSVQKPVKQQSVSLYAVSLPLHLPHLAY